MVSDMTLVCSIPMTLTTGQNGPGSLSVCSVYHSNIITEAIHKRLRTTQVSGIPGIYFGDIVNLVLNKGRARIYVAGGYLRDLFLGKDADDMDILFAQDGHSDAIGLVPYLVNVANSKGWPVVRKVDERTNNPRWDFICIGDKSEKDGNQKFTGHPVGVGCEGEFCCNTMMFNIMTGTLIDPTGYGWKDAINFILRIPYQSE